MEMAEGGPEYLHEPLTQRERNILAHLADHKSSQEIAGLETLAHSSVKWYIHQVYLKLGVNRRNDAVARARQMGLLLPKPAVINPSTSMGNSLPRQLSSFIGREKEIAQLLALVQEHSLVTLTGSGGTGKTRLALQVAERALRAFEDGAWFVDLAGLSDPGLVPLATATGLGLHDIPRTSTTHTLSQFIGKKNLLLILDNCEHVVGAAAGLARDLLHVCPNLHILATSREGLAINGEKSYRCPPLCLPDPQTTPTFAELAQSEAVRLFVERAQSVSSDFRLTPTNARLVERVCRRLDGIPLAIELAAARVRLLSMDQITTRLVDVFHLLTGGGRVELARHQTLKTLVDWSYDLLSEKERLLLCRLSVFAGSWTLEAAEVVCADSPDGRLISAQEILDLLGQLVDKSLVNVLNEPGAQDTESRYHMLEMIRQYAHHRLLEGGSLDALREQHLDYYLALSLKAELYLRAKDGREWKERLEKEIDNLRLAMEWSISGSIEKGLRLAAALQWFWHGTRNRIEGVSWLNRLLAAEASEVIALTADPNKVIQRKIARGKALNASSYIGRLIAQDGRDMGREAAGIFKSLGNLCLKDLAYSYYLSKEKSLLECLENFRNLNEPFYICEMLLFLTQNSRWRGEFKQARAYAEERVNMIQKMGDIEGGASGLWELGMLEFLEGNLRLARENFLSSQACCNENGSEEVYPFLYRFFAWIALVRGDVQEAIHYSQAQLTAGNRYFTPWVIADALGFLGWEALTDGDQDLAVQYCEDALKLTGQADASLISVAHYVLARVLLARGDFDRARASLQFFVSHNYHSWPPVQLGIQAFGILAAMQMADQPDQARRAAVLFGAQDEIHGCLMNVIPQPERKVYNQALKSVHRALNSEDFSAAYAEGRAMTTEQAIRYALMEGNS
jgi:predicted ATPase/DNA-binding CsgD family transcriptional regulator